MEIKLENYDFTYHRKKLLENINLELKSGNIYLLKGRNGSGKTMLLRAISGLINPTNGKRYVNNNITNDFLDSVGIIIGNMTLPPEYTGLQNLKMLNNINNKVSIDGIKQILKLLELDHAQDEYVKNYSLGMQQKLNLAQALMEKPKVLCLDEPTNGLDKESVKIVIKLLKDYDQDAIIIIASHNTEDFAELAYNLIEIDSGKIYSN